LRMLADAIALVEWPEVRIGHAVAPQEPEGQLVSNGVKAPSNVP
jgi:hypothetical protein